MQELGPGARQEEGRGHGDRPKDGRRSHLQAGAERGGMRGPHAPRCAVGAWCGPAARAGRRVWLRCGRGLGTCRQGGGGPRVAAACAAYQRSVKDGLLEHLSPHLLDVLVLGRSHRRARARHHLCGRCGALLEVPERGGTWHASEGAGLAGRRRGGKGVACAVREGGAHLGENGECARGPDLFRPRF